VVCECPPAVAAIRFKTRNRHPGHFDTRAQPEELLRGFERLAEAGPVTTGAVVCVDTTMDVDGLDVCVAIRALLP
jgi:hypothetical protein